MSWFKNDLSRIEAELAKIVIDSRANSHRLEKIERLLKEEKVEKINYCPYCGSDLEIILNYNKSVCSSCGKTIPKALLKGEW